VTDDEMVHIGRDMVEAALATAPKSIHCRAGARTGTWCWSWARSRSSPAQGRPTPRI
jgi:trimethylamine--corrinoid protein Co-methyltransferase